MRTEMNMQIQWTTTDPETGEKLWLCAERFARIWHFKTRAHRRAEWTRDVPPTRAMWEHVLDALKRKYTRRDEAELHDIADVEVIVGKLPPE
jgi:hypothetical protein